MQVVFALSSIYEWNQMPGRNLRTIVLPQLFFTYSLYDSADSQNL